MARKNKSKKQSPTNTVHPIKVLRDIEQRCIAVARGLPQQEQIKEAWTGISFKVGDLQLIAPLKQVNEVMHYPKLTMFPGTQSWVKGIANIRGSLIPVMDLSAYLGKQHTNINLQTRIMVVRDGEMNFGLVVDEVQGLKHFSDEEKTTAVSKFDSAFEDYIQGAFKQNGEESLVFNMRALAVHPDFYKVAV